MNEKVGMITTFLSFIIGWIFPDFTDHEQNHITFWVQTFAFVISIVVGILTAIKLICYLRDRRATRILNENYDED